jgi:predicted dehydrogenase
MATGPLHEESNATMKTITRRNFIHRSGKGLVSAAVGATTLGALQRGLAAGANERVRVAIIGCGGRAKFLAPNLIEAGAEIACLCDLHPGHMESLAGEHAGMMPRKPRMTRNVETVWDDRGIDAVVIATPDHWHAALAIDACRAGKDVYVEKPHAHNIWESRQMVAAARRHNRIVQVGTQNRSAPYNQLALDYVKSGKLGRIALIKVYNLEPGRAFQLGEPGAQPAGLDWDRWLGPAPVRPWHQRLYQGGWHRFWDFSGGDMTDDGIHQMDLALMIMGDRGRPRTISACGGKMAFPEADGESPDVQVVHYQFGDFVLTFEMTNYPRYMQKSSDAIRRNDLLPYWTMNATRIEIYGSELMMTVGRHGGGWIVAQVGGREVEKQYGRPGDAPHAKNFIDCVKTRRRPNADIEVAHASCSIAHLGNIAYRVPDQKLRFDWVKERFVGSPEADKLLRRQYREEYAVPEMT